MITVNYIKNFPPLKPLETVVHVGAWRGGEIEKYIAAGFSKIIYIEADPSVYSDLLRRVGELERSIRHKVITLNALITDQDDEVYDFHVFDNDGVSSSIYKSTELKRLVCKVKETGEIKRLTSSRLDTVLYSLDLPPETISAIVFDIQGAEFKGLLGLGKFLKYPMYLEVEVSSLEYYENAPLYPYVEMILESSKFKRVTPVPNHYDCLFINKRHYVRGLSI
ncbi:hypothetical protein PMIT1313_01177 [Prochlorococcus marinus str. MIT 1313]|uniref:FkbM family methyltransferase n=1 Tax=Prochlorococcus TaxID=1218 RepID=UPI0007B36C89|nr:FkbM family methyltransferase [Prochlorococcus marinus]KZR69489.1 hypothetical protein PMIT1313_01177 [Prochlorococcus marinus str. MIT 1313]KZR72564.1 hypothetical protein PMIT1318_01078 [Prochlorococcus marinus str. MIT 1318]